MPQNKDRQAPVSPPVQRIFILSSLLHWMTMPFIVFLRWGLGYSFLKPRVLFFSFSCAALVGFDFSRHKSELWNEFWAICTFGVVATILYWLHTFLAFLRHFGANAEHDSSFGKPWLLLILRMVNRDAATALESVWLIWIEPTLLMVAGLALWNFIGEQWLSRWLMITAPAFWFKEFLNVWHALRQKKKHADAIEDSLELMEDEPGEKSSSPPLLNARTAKVERTRRHELSAEDELRLNRSGKLLEISPPYQLVAAEQSYRRLAKKLTGMNLPSSDYSAKLAELNDAIAIIRKHLS